MWHVKTGAFRGAISRTVGRMMGRHYTCRYVYDEGGKRYTHKPAVLAGEVIWGASAVYCRFGGFVERRVLRVTYRKQVAAFKMSDSYKVLYSCR